MKTSHAIAIGCALQSFAISTATAGPLQAEPIGIGELLKVGGGLLVVVTAIVVTAALLKRLKSMHNANGAHMRIVDGISLSTRDRIMLLEVNHRRLLLGVSPGKIETLHVFDAEGDPAPPFVEMVEHAAVSDGGGVPR